MGLKKNLNPLKISEQICQFSLCRDSSVGNIVPCFCFRLSYLYHMESSVSNRFRMVIFSLHCLKEFPNSALKMMTRYIFRVITSIYKLILAGTLSLFGQL